MAEDNRNANDSDPKKEFDLSFASLHPEALGEDEKHRPQPIDESPSLIEAKDLLDMMRRTIDQLERDRSSRGDLKILNRTLRELRYALKVFQPFRRRRKITIFGSARTRPDHPTYSSAEELGKKMAGHGWMVITGAGGGIMEAGHKGAGREMSMGLNIMLPFEQSANEFIVGDPKLVTLKYFFTRKLMFIKECSSVVCLPGGYGTLDETLEVITLLQTGKQTMLPLVLLDSLGGTFWKSLEEFFNNSLLANELVSPDDHRLYYITDNVDDCIAHTMNFYRVYNSMRYVDNTLVLRINRELTSEQLNKLNSDFASILVSGTIEASGPLPEEDNEPEIAHLPRLRLHFNRRAFGKLRMLIDAINDC